MIEAESERPPLVDYSICLDPDCEIIDPDIRYALAPVLCELDKLGERISNATSPQGDGTIIQVCEYINGKVVYSNLEKGGDRYYPIRVVVGDYLCDIGYHCDNSGKLKPASVYKGKVPNTFA